jgi:hypothetical protein
VSDSTGRKPFTVARVVRIGIWVAAASLLLGVLARVWRQVSPPSLVVASDRPALSPTTAAIVLVSGAIIMLVLLVLGEVWTRWEWRPASERQRARWALATIAASSAYLTATAYFLSRLAPEEGTPEAFAFQFAWLIFLVLMTIAAGSFLEHLFHYPQLDPQLVRDRDDPESRFWGLTYALPALAISAAFWVNWGIEKEYAIPMAYDLRIRVVMTVVVGCQVIGLFIARKRIASLVRLAVGHDARS